MIDKIGLNILLMTQHKSKVDWANYLGITSTTLHRKLNGESDFFREEIKKTCDFFGLDDMNEYFFTKKVT